MSYSSTVPDEVYRRAYDWLATQPNGVAPAQLVARVRLETWRMAHAEPCPQEYQRRISPNVLTSFENRGMLLSEDAEGRLYAWPAKQHVISHERGLAHGQVTREVKQIAEEK